MKVSKINILESNVYNQIAAGEVVENPASIVKELVENCIDAGAANISVSIEEGGVKSIIIVDDGEGMNNEDLMKSILPHSTSKIKNIDDLSTISTLGFRGEALSSIASVSQLEIKSKYFENEHGNKLLVMGGEVLENQVTSLNKGTTITITKLFYNTPARYKFLKSARSEENNVTSLMADIILSNSDISFKYFVDKKLFYSSPGEGLRSSVESVYDKDIVNNLIELNYSQSSYTVEGYIAKPNSTAIRPNRNYQTIIINGRIVKDFTLSAVVQNAYSQSLMKRTFPTFILDIIMPFGQVDVNVHPNKKEVRFAEDCKVKSILYTAIKDALDKFEYEKQQQTSFIKQPEQINKDIHGDFAEYRKEEYKFIANNHKENTLKDFLEPKINSDNEVHQKNPKDLEKVSKKFDYLSEIEPKASEHITRLKEEEGELELPTLESYKVIGQIFDTYIIIEYDDSIFLIDQHAAHERLIYDDYLHKMQNMPLDIQDLLVPYIFQTDFNGAQLILQNKKVLSEMGFTVEEFGNNLIKIVSVPLQFVEINFDDFFTDMIDYLIGIKSIDDINTVKDSIAKKACKSSIRGGRSLSQENINHIIKTVFRQGVPLQCPHGRPVTVKLSRSEIEKMFRRIV